MRNAAHASVAILALVAAFSCDTPMDPHPAELHGEYLLRMIGTLIVPARQPTHVDAAHWDTTYGGMITLRPDGRYVRRHESSACTGGQYFWQQTCAQRVVSIDSGAWSANDEVIQFASGLTAHRWSDGLLLCERVEGSTSTCAVGLRYIMTSQLDTLELSDVVGSFTLVQVDGNGLPAYSIQHPNGTRHDTVFSGALTLRSDGRFVREWDRRECSYDFLQSRFVCGARVTTRDSASWVVARDSIILDNVVRGTGDPVLNLCTYLIAAPDAACPKRFSYQRQP